MRLGKLIIKEIKQALRDKQGLVMMIVFPLILTVVLGTALSGMFETTSTPSKIDALYCVEGNSSLGQVFTSMFIPESKSMNLTLTEEKDLNKAKRAVQNGETSCFIDVDGDKITVYAREGRTMNASLVDTYVNVFARKYDAYAVVGSENLAAIPKLQQEDQSGTVFTEDVSLDRSRKPRAIDYYALTMLTLIVMYGSMYGISAITDERKSKTLYRLFSTPVRNVELLTAKVLGNILAISAQIGFVFLIDKVFLNTYWGNNPLPIFIILLAQIIMMISFGVAIGYLFKNNDSGMGLVQTIIPIMAFLGGAYVNLDMLGLTGFIQNLTKISPITWINKTILQIVYAGDYTDFGTTIAMCMGIAVVFLGLSAVFSRKELKV